mmetsp:Transcript_111879/g.311405  ORF Transcript_111879/g.311405 Transcript_111879/m.311405 type:complete len:203 (-) Transcript_111879:189-797(-)
MHPVPARDPRTTLHEPQLPFCVLHAERLALMSRQFKLASGLRVASEQPAVGILELGLMGASNDAPGRAAVVEVEEEVEAASLAIAMAGELVAQRCHPNHQQPIGRGVLLRAAQLCVGIAEPVCVVPQKSNAEAEGRRIPPIEHDAALLHEPALVLPINPENGWVTRVLINLASDLADLTPSDRSRPEVVFCCRGLSRLQLIL